jgi:hypothetical protein
VETTDACTSTLVSVDPDDHLEPVDDELVPGHYERAET